MKVTDYLEKSPDQTHISFEVLPPLKGGSMQDIFDTLDPLMEFKPPFIDVTYHREEYIYKKRVGGYSKRLPSVNAPEQLEFARQLSTVTRPMPYLILSVAVLPVKKPRMHSSN